MNIKINEAVSKGNTCEAINILIIQGYKVQFLKNQHLKRLYFDAIKNNEELEKTKKYQSIPQNEKDIQKAIDKGYMNKLESMIVKSDKTLENWDVNIAVLLKDFKDEE